MDEQRTRGSRQVDHTADMALEVWAEDEAALLDEAARALVQVLTEGAAVAAQAEVTVAIDALDAEDRLVQWLNEVLYLATTRGFLYREAAIALDGAALRATVRGEPGAAGRIATELKSATYHDLRLEVAPGRAFARVVIDV